MGTNMSSNREKRLNKTKRKIGSASEKAKSRKKSLSCCFLLPLIRFRMMNHATSAVFAIKSPSPIKAMPNTRSFGSASSSFSSFCTASGPLRSNGNNEIKRSNKQQNKWIEFINTKKNQIKEKFYWTKRPMERNLFSRSWFRLNMMMRPVNLCGILLPPFKFFLWRLWRQQAISRILIRTNPVPDEIPISIKSPLDVFMNGLPVVSVCCVVRIDMDGCGATDFTCSRLLGVFFMGKLVKGWSMSRGNC